MQFTLSLKNTFVSIVSDSKLRPTLSRAYTTDCVECCEQDSDSIELKIDQELISLRDASSRASVSTVAEPMTTVMLRNIPNRYRQEWLVEEILAAEPGCDFVYLPLNSNKKNTNLGYAFVNFEEEWQAEKFMEEFRGHQFMRQLRSLKRAEITPAKMQGKDVNIAVYEERAAQGILNYWVRA